MVFSECNILHSLVSADKVNLCVSKSMNSSTAVRNIFHTVIAKYCIVLAFIQHISDPVIVILCFTRWHDHLKFTQWAASYFLSIKMCLCDLGIIIGMSFSRHKIMEFFFFLESTLKSGNQDHFPKQFSCPMLDFSTCLIFMYLISLFFN